MNYSSGDSANPPEVYQRRESLVKPTWHNVAPGQVPADTLDKLKKMNNGAHEHYANSGGSFSATGGGSGLNNNQINVMNGSGPSGGGGGHQHRQEEAFDLFGKVYSFTLTHTK